MPNKPTDQELSELYQSGGESRSPASLDEKVLAQARAQAPQSRKRMPAWLPLASAASVVGLTLTLLYQVVMVEPERFKAPESKQPLMVRAPTTRVSEPDATLVSEAEEADVAVADVLSAPDLKRELRSRSGSDYSDDAKPARKMAAAKEKAQFDMAVAESAASMPAEPHILEDVLPAERAGAISPPEPVLEAAPWLENIEELVKQEDLEKARLEYRAFRKHYPQYEVSAELRKVLEVSVADQPPAANGSR